MITLGAEACFDHVLRSISAKRRSSTDEAPEAQAARIRMLREALVLVVARMH